MSCTSAVARFRCQLFTSTNRAQASSSSKQWSPRSSSSQRDYQAPSPTEKVTARRNKWPHWSNPQRREVDSHRELHKYKTRGSASLNPRSTSPVQAEIKASIVNCTRKLSTYKRSWTRPPGTMCKCTTTTPAWNQSSHQQMLNDCPWLSSRSEKILVKWWPTRCLLAPARREK